MKTSRYICIGLFLFCGIVITVAQTLNVNETDKLKQFLALESVESGKKNYQQLGIQSLETMDWSKINGLVWNVNGRLDSLTWNNKKLGGNLNLSDFAELRYILCVFNGITSINVTGCTVLRYFDCFNNNLTSVDVSTNINLEWICCRWQNTSLKEIDLTHNPKLYHFCGTGNEFELMDLSKNPELEDFFCAATRLKKIDVSKNLKLKRVYLRGNQLTELDFSKHPELETLTCYDNQLETLDVSGCPKLKSLLAYNNNLKGLKIDYIDMDELQCQNNCMTFSTLPKLKSCGNFVYADQKPIIIKTLSNIVDVSSEYNINGNLTEFFWVDGIVPIEQKGGVFTFNSSANNFDFWAVNATSFPGLIVKYAVELYATVSVDTLQDIDMYANGNRLYIKTNNALTVAIYTISGALVGQFSISEGEQVIPLLKGIYIVRLNNGMVRKIMIQ